MVPFNEDFIQDTFSFFGIPDLILYTTGKCETCMNSADMLCDDCETTELCTGCFEAVLRRCETYRVFMDEAEVFTCIYCFVELQHEELKRKPDDDDLKVQEEDYPER